MLEISLLHAKMLAYQEELRCMTFVI